MIRSVKGNKALLLTKVTKEPAELAIFLELLMFEKVLTQQHLEHEQNRLLSYVNEEIEVLKHDDFCKEKLHFEVLCIDKFKRIVVRDGNEIELTYTEFEILLLLAQNAGIVFSKEQIYDSVWKEPYFGDYNIVMSHIRNIREKIEDNPSKPVYIQTVWGVGYRFNQTLQIREML